MLILISASLIFGQTPQQGVVADSAAGILLQKEYFSLDEATKEPYKTYNLNWQDKQLKELPAEIGQLTKLSMLTLWSNNLRTLSVEMSLLTELQSIDVSSNTELDIAFASTTVTLAPLKNLLSFNLWNNTIANIPFKIECPAALRIVNLSSNKLAFLLLEIEVCINFQTLYGGENKLISLPISAFEKLFRLGNQLKALPDDICKLTG